MTNELVISLQGQNCVLVGAGGHAKVVQELAELCGAQIIGVCDPKFVETDEKYWNGLSILGGDEYLVETNPESILLLNGLGMLPGSKIRKNVYERFTEMGYRFPSLVHPFSWLSSFASIKDGVQLMAGAVVQAGVSIGSNTIINTRSSIDHDSRIDSHCHIAPGATLCGDVKVGTESFIGAGSVVIQGINIGSGSFIKASSKITRDII